jgi:hypothetical protein
LADRGKPEQEKEKRMSDYNPGVKESAVSGSARDISLGDGFGDVAFKVNGATVEVHADGSVAAYTPKDVDAYTNGAVHVHRAANDSRMHLYAEKIVGAGQVEEVIGLEIGDKMPAGHPNAGWIYAGISKTTHQLFYVAPKDSGLFQWKEAMAFAAKDGSRVPSKDELNQIYDAQDQGALKGTFNLTGSDPAGWYWSSRDGGHHYACAQRFSDGGQDVIYKGDDSSLRCVR